MIPRYNQAPGQNAPIVLEENGSHHLRMMHWGVSIFDRTGGKSQLINVRSESILERRAFTGKIMSRLCIVPATGFYEWASLSSSVAKQPYHIALPSGDLFGFAGICQYKQARSNATIPNFAIITKAANGGIAEIHSRMPVILRKADENLWLSCNPQDCSAMQLIFNRSIAEEMLIYPVSRRVNNVAYDQPDCLVKIPFP